MVRIVKRYANRKLYDTETSSYVTLDGVAELVRQGYDVRVVDNETGEDLTALTFAQIILEREKKKNGFLSLPSLRWIIREGEGRLQEIVQTVDRGREAVREIAERGVERLVGGKNTKGLLGELLERPQRSLDHLQRQIDEQVRRSMQKLAGHPAVQSELRRIQTSLRRLEKKLERLQSPRRRRSKGRRATNRE
ncbi:MAG: hypothetical protein KatS3mg076_1171 [Candidatus Binatia bacterium]|nr:MAG: hypothetical protein KatS3mg076_1171 [Candidatus Binatia bacterium]